MCYSYVFAKAQGEHISDIHIEGMWGWDLEICHMFADSLAVLILNSYFTDHFCGQGVVVTHPKILS